MIAWNARRCCDEGPRRTNLPQIPLIPANAGTHFIERGCCEFVLGVPRSGVAFYCYIVASGQLGTLYIGSTDCLTTRVGQHKSKAIPGFTAKYGCDQLVWFRTFDTRQEAFQCERRMKEWRRSWKILVIQEENPNWRDLYWEACGLLAPGQVEAFLTTLPTRLEG